MGLGLELGVELVPTVVECEDGGGVILRRAPRGLVMRCCGPGYCVRWKARMWWVRSGGKGAPRCEMFFIEAA